MTGVDETALAFDRAARKAGTHYAFMGAFAVMAWGEPRATSDVDALLEYSEADAEALVLALSAEGLTGDARDFIDALSDGTHVTVFHEKSVFWLDIKPARSVIERQQVADAAEVTIRAQRIRIVRPEETIAFKLAFGSPKDEQDAASILVRQAGALDETRLSEFAAKLGVATKLARLREDLPR